MSTQRSKSDLDALFPDNTTRQISPGRLRDFVESCVPSYGAMHFDDPGTQTAIAAVTTWTKASNTTSLHDGAHRFSQAANNRLRYDGSTSVAAFASATIAVSAASSNKKFSFALGVNGTILEVSRCTTKIASGGDVQHVSVTLHTTMLPGDYFELYVMNETDDTDLTIEHAYLVVFAYMI